MSQKETNEVFTIVAFRYDQARSVLYTHGGFSGDVVLHVRRAIDDYKADVISIRRVYPQHPQPQITIQPQDNKAKHKARYVKCRQDGTYSPLTDDNMIMTGLVLTCLPEDGVCVGEYDL